MKMHVTVAALLIAGPAAAALTDVSFHGHGVVTYSLSDPPWIGPAVGTPVDVSGSVHLGSAGGMPGSGYPVAQPDDFTGRFTITQDMVIDHYSIYSWRVVPGDVASSLDPADEFAGGTLDFVHGRLVGLNLSYVGDPDGHALSSRNWGVDFGADSAAQWGGTWRLDVPAGTPEPTTWALLVTGFGLVGVSARRRAAA